MFDFLTNKFSSIFSVFSSNKALTENQVRQTLDKVKDALLQADVPYELVMEFVDDLQKELIEQVVIRAVNSGQQIMKIVQERITLFLTGKESNKVAIPERGTIMVMGLQGSGKTTTIGKLAHLIAKEAQKSGKKKSVLLASVDFCRPAAIDQLEIISKQANTFFYRSGERDPVQAARDIQSYAQRYGLDVLLLDTAGRLHIDQELLKELTAINNAVAAALKILVLDAMTGQESLSVARSFDAAVGFDMAILSKFDSDSRGGAAFSFRYALKKPIGFVGVGEKIADLELFHPDRVAGRMLDQGDLATLTERANEKIEEKEQEAAYKAFMTGNFTLADFAQQMQMMQRIGNMSQLLRYIPGMGALKLSSDMIEKGEGELKRFKAIINSMTQKERLNHKIIDKSRKKRISRGAGVLPAAVDDLISRFEQSKQYATLFKKMGKFNNLFK